MKMTMTQPCPNCPFRNDILPFITAARAREICDGLERGNSTFTCHETTIKGEEDESGFSDMTDGPNAQHCAGALILCEKAERPTQLMRIYERLRGYSYRALNMDAPIYDSFAEMVRAHKIAKVR